MPMPASVGDANGDFDYTPCVGKEKVVGFGQNLNFKKYKKNLCQCEMKVCVYFCTEFLMTNKKIMILNQEFI